MKRTVLIVEDDPSFAEFLEVTVRAAGYETVTAHDGEKAIRLFDELSPDLVFLDLLVPKKDGYAICKEIRSRENGAVPIVVSTGIYKKKEYKKAMQEEYGVTDYLVKPVRIADLWEVLGRYMKEDADDLDQAGAFCWPVPTAATESLFSGEPVQERPLAAVLAEHVESRRTGLLFLKDSGRVLILYMDMGQIVFARSNAPESRMGDLLVRRGLLSDEDRMKAETYLAQAGDGMRMGEVLVGMDLLNKDRLEETVREHLEELVIDAFRSEGWKSHFVEGELPDEESIRIERPSRDLILAGIREMKVDNGIRTHLPDPGTVLNKCKNAKENAALLGLTPYEEKMLDLCDGTRPVRKILSIGKLAPVEIERLLFAFLHTGLVTCSGSQERATVGAASLAGDVKKQVAVEGRVEDMAGSFEDKLLPEILVDLHTRRATGVLSMEQGESKAWLYLDNGDLVFAGTNEQCSRIGEILIETRLVTEEEVKAAARSIEDESDAPRLGQKLVDDGLITYEELSWAITMQMQKRVQRIFPWSSGSWEFKGGPFPTDEPITLGFRTLDVVMEGVRRIDPAVLESRLPSGNWTLKATSTNETLRQLNLTPEEQRLLSRLKSTPALDSILDGGEFSGEMARQAVYAFLTLGLAKTERERTMEEEADTALDFLGQGPAPPPRPRKSKPAPAPKPELVPKVLLDQSQAKQEEMRKQMYELFKQFENMKQTVSALQDEILTLKTSPIYDRLEPDMRDTVGSILDEYLDRLINNVH